MRHKSLLAIHSYCNQFAEAKKQHLLSILDPEDQHKVSAMDRNLNVERLNSQRTDFLYHIHTTWMIDLLKHFSKEDALLLLSGLQQIPHTHKETITKELDLSETPLKSTHAFFQDFVVDLLFKRLSLSQDIEPFSTLSTNHPFYNILLFTDLKAKQVIRVLGLHDVSLELKRVIDKKALKHLEDSLNPFERKVIKKLYHRKDLIHIAPLKLSQWDGSMDLLSKIVYRRGLNRFAKAIADESMTLKQYLMWKFTKEDGKTIESFCVETKNRKILNALKSQLGEAIEMTKDDTLQ